MIYQHLPLRHTHTHNTIKKAYPNSGHLHANMEHLTLRFGVRIITAEDLSATRKGSTRHIGKAVVGRRFVVVKLGIG